MSNQNDQPDTFLRSVNRITALMSLCRAREQDQRQTARAAKVKNEARLYKWVAGRAHWI